MPFIGQDWREPGEKWIRTKEGWERQKLRPINSDQEEMFTIDGLAPSSSPPAAAVESPTKASPTLQRDASFTDLSGTIRQRITTNNWQRARATRRCRGSRAAS